MTPDQDLSARLADHLSKEAWYVDMLETQGRDYYDPPYENKLKDSTNKACGDAYRSGQLITLADHERAVQSAVAKAVEAEREAIVDMFLPEQLTVWSSEILGDLSAEGVLDIQEYGEKVVAYDIVARNLQALAAAIRGGWMSDYFEHRRKCAALRDAEAEGLVSDSMDVRKALLERMHAGELTLDEVKAELARIKRQGRKSGMVTRAQAYSGRTP